MLNVIEDLLGALEEGRVSRREAVGRLVAVVAAASGLGTAAAAAERPVAEAAGPTFDSRGLDHIALRVTDLERSRKFYERHLGLRTYDRSQWNTFMACGEDDFVALFKSDTPGLDHFAFRVDGYDAGETVRRGESAGLRMVRQENRVYFDDPDGITLQISG